MSSGILLAIAGVWLLAQILRGDFLKRIGLT